MKVAAQSYEWSQITLYRVSAIVWTLGKIIEGLLFDRTGDSLTELDLEDIKLSRLDFDVNGHYARHDIFDFKVKGQPEIKEEESSLQWKAINTIIKVSMHRRFF